MSADSSMPVASYPRLTVYEVALNDNLTGDLITDVPPEIALMVFARLTLPELASASLTSKIWRVLAVHELSTRGKNKWSFLDSLISQGCARSAYHLANTLPFSDPVYRRLFNQADNKDNFCLSLKIASYKDYNPVFIRRLAHCFNRHESVNFGFLRDWILGLHPGNPDVVSTAQHLIAEIAKRYAINGNAGSVRRLFSLALQKDASLIDLSRWKEIREHLSGLQMLFLLLDMEAASPPELQGDIHTTTACLCNLPDGMSQLANWAKRTDADPMFILDVMLRISAHLIELDLRDQAVSVINVLLGLKYLDRTSQCISRIDNQIFFEVVIATTSNCQRLTEIFVDVLIGLRAWDDAKRVANSCNKLNFRLPYLLEKIDLAKGLTLSQVEMEVEREHKKINDFYRDMQTKKKPVAIEYPDDDEELYLSYLDHSGPNIEQSGPDSDK